MNLAIEDSAVVVSTRNIYAAVQGRKKEAANVRLVGRSGFQSVTDVFLDPASAGNVVASVRVATSGGPGLSLRHASFYNNATRIGRVIDCRGAPKAPVSISNTAIAGSAICLAFDSGARVESDHNCYFNATGGPIIEVSGARRRQIVSENLRGFAEANAVERNSIAADPRFADPERLNFSLAANSPARRAGAGNPGLVDAVNAPFQSPPNIGAIAENGDLSRRARP
jgi:hypothetical protein